MIENKANRTYKKSFSLVKIWMWYGIGKGGGGIKFFLEKKSLDPTCNKAGLNLKFWKFRILRYWSFILTSTVSLSLKLVFSKRAIFAF